MDELGNIMVSEIRVTQRLTVHDGLHMRRLSKSCKWEVPRWLPGAGQGGGREWETVQ